MTTPEPNTLEALHFLELFCGDEPVVLTAIIPDGGPVESQTLRPKTHAEKAREWIDGFQGKRNIYFTVNATSRAITGRNKARKIDIRGMRALHVDIDPRLGEGPRRNASALFAGFRASRGSRRSLLTAVEGAKLFGSRRMNTRRPIPIGLRSWKRITNNSGSSSKRTLAKTSTA